MEAFFVVDRDREGKTTLDTRSDGDDDDDATADVRSQLFRKVCGLHGAPSSAHV